MLQGIRDSARGWLAWAIVIVICIPFAFWGINEYFNPAPKRIIAEVNGVELSERDFQQQVSQRKRQLYAMLQDQDIDLSFMEKQIRQSTLTQMIEQEVLIQSITDAGMQISNALLATRIHSFPMFQKEGDFSQEHYEQALRYQGMTPTGFEWQIRRALLTDQLREGVLRSALWTDYEQEQHIRLDKQQRSISYLIIPASRFNDSVTITDAEIETRYKEHAKQYMTPEKVSIEYVELSQHDVLNTQSIDEESLQAYYQERKTTFIRPGEWKARHILIEVDQNAPLADREAAEKKTQDLLAKIRRGDSFEKLAQQFSDDIGSKKQGGDLDWFGPGMMVKPFEEAIEVLKVGEVSEPVETQFGYHLIKLEDKKPEVIRPFEQVRTQLEQEIQKEHAEAVFYEKAEQFANLAFEHPDSLEVLTETLNLERKVTDWFDRTGNQQKAVLSHRKVIEAAFSDTVLQEGYNSDPIEIGEQHIVVLRLKDHLTAKAKPLIEVKEEIITALKQEKTRTQTQALGQTLLEQINKKGNPDILAKEHDLNWSPSQWIQRQDNTLASQIVHETFKIGQPSENKALYEGIKLDNGNYALIAILAVKDGQAPTDKENERPKHSEQTKQQRAVGQSEFNLFISALKASAEIKDYSANLSGN